MMLIRTHIIALISEARRAQHSEVLKPETVVFAEAVGIREAYAFEKVHCHEPDKTTCIVCGLSGFMVWTESKDKFMQHKDRCGDLPPVTVELI